MSTDAQRADAIAQTIVRGFDHYRARFEQLSAGARQRFERADWHGMQSATTERVDLYDQSVGQTVEQCHAAVGSALSSDQVWKRAKRAYVALIVERPHGELAETYFNSIYCRTFAHQAIDEEKIFIRSELPPNWSPPATGILNRYPLRGSLPRLIGKILDDYAFCIPYENRRRDIRNLVRYIKEHPVDGVRVGGDAVLEIIKSVFYRNKGAYLVGRVVGADGKRGMPFVMPVLNNERGGVYVDTLILNPDEVSIIFSFTRSYFMVEAPVPFEYVRFLQQLMPGKQLYELYSSLGFYKHGKTVFYRDFLDHMAASSDQFVVAPGIKGMVMAVFTLPSLDVVFKIIKDRFHPTKEVDRDTVLAKYRLVKRHDKAGRMADTQEFSNFVFERDRFSDELLAELLQVAPSSVSVEGDKVRVRHLWTERRMIPLNLYIDDADEARLNDAIDEYGNAIRQLAAANIFPGDMLFKNFGVTRHGRVVFYDYDEILYLTECNFRRVPPPRYPEDELASEPWYSVAPNDVFPEEFAAYLASRADVRRVFMQRHREIFDPAYWQGLQEAIIAGEVVDVFPYRRRKRFDRGAQWL
ncbi:bifunctional isocitrate dehydrogenase kinase/phosphatase [Motiliproteus sediminis]|uniref:bifunctional isocitrate dehydrogenase kinase/phosphatase n=1 Tax=Motiliproteus sediminis TaxID=1468178 RepID=UPI001AEFC616|nr:bifunctional isocitrate dehydrogenase kinase/phosphatase [Motiliproteus sediminis]